MIVKHIPMRSLGKSDFAGLVNYITDAQSKDHRLGQVRLTNCEAGSVRDAITEVLATQHVNTRAKGDKTYHLIVSFRAGELPSADTLRAIEERICAGLGYGEHQRISAVHNDTDNLHMHIAINKIHPAQHTMHEPYYPHRALAELCTALERDYGLENDNHVPRRRGSEGRAADMEQHAGVESLVGWIKRECLDEIRGAQSWQELHQIMLDNGLALRERANGLVIEAGDGTMVKASTLARDLSKPKLEARLGPFVASPERQGRTQTKRQYQKSPIRLRVNTVELYARYKAAQQDLTAARRQALDQALRRKARLIDAAKRAGRLRRATIKMLGENPLTKKVLYVQASQALRNELQEIHKRYQKERQALYTAHSRRTWADWLKAEAAQGNTEALGALRAREAAQGLQGNTIQGQGAAQFAPTPAIDNITKKGTIIYRAGLSAVRDDGIRLQVSREATREGLQEALRLTMERYGNRITVNGTVDFKARIIRAAVASQLPITFADPALESRRQALLKENDHGRTEPQPAEHRGRAGRGAGSVGQRRAAHRDSASAGVGIAGAGGHVGKPNIGRLGRVPPPESRHRLRTLSQLGVVRVADGAEMLLPRDVPGHMEQQRPRTDHELRRGIHRSGSGVAPGLTAADKYIAERAEKRSKGFDIPNHIRYTDGSGDLSFAGVRNIEGQALALLKRGDEIMVMPIDSATSRRLSRCAVGESVTVTAKGSVKTSKGKSR